MDNLLHLVQAYLYEGWDEYEYDTWRDAVDVERRRRPQSRREQTARRRHEECADRVIRRPPESSR